MQYQINKKRKCSLSAVTCEFDNAGNILHTFQIVKSWSFFLLFFSLVLLWTLVLSFCAQIPAVSSCSLGKVGFPGRRGAMFDTPHVILSPGSHERFVDKRGRLWVFDQLTSTTTKHPFDCIFTQSENPIPLSCYILRLTCQSGSDSLSSKASGSAMVGVQQKHHH